jgi:heme/copper-type cytochrome/quinol oxidase subunit 4
VGLLGYIRRVTHGSAARWPGYETRCTSATVGLLFDAASVDTPSAPTAARAESAALVTQWHKGLRIAHIAQSRSAAACELRGALLGVAVIILTTIVGTAIFSTLASSPSTAVKIVAGLASVGAGVLAALQTFLGLDKRAAKHREVAAAYGALRRELETSMAFPDESTRGRELLDDVRRRWDALDATAPVTSQRIHRFATRAVAGSPTAPDGNPPGGA